MSRRIIDVSEMPAVLSLRGGLLVITQGRGAEVTVPLDEIEAVLLSNPQCSITGRLMAELGKFGVSIVCSDETRLPTGIMLPIGEHGKIATRFALQAAMKLPVRKKLWRQVVRAKIRNQASVITAVRGTDYGLPILAREVLSGDRTNVEAQAAVRYWRNLFDDPDFRRDPAIGGRNALLNYGYAIVRSSVARAICGVGLHPALGLHHHNRSNPLCLADDLMEPFRPIVDLAVAGFGLGEIVPPELSSEVKRRLVAEISARFTVKDESRTTFDWISRSVVSLARVVDGVSERIWLPSISFAP